jgi:DNA-binding transcriptional LysR family regulator
MPIFTTATRCFEEVARHGSVRRAADHLNLTGSAVNRQILHLEGEVGTALFERLPRGMRLNAAGELLLASVRRQKRDLKAALSQVEALRGLRRGHVVITALSYLAQTDLASFIAKFRRDYPGITFTLLSGNSEQIVNHVIDGTADIGFGYPAQRGSQVRRVAEWPTRFGAIVSRNHPLAAVKRVRLRDCMAYPLVLPEPGMESRTFAEQYGISRWPDRTIAVETNSFPSLIGLVKADVGIGFVSEFDIRADVDAGSVVFKPLAEPAALAPRLCLMVRADRTLPFATSIVLQQFGESMQHVVDRAMHRRGKTVAKKSTVHGKNAALRKRAPA